MLTQATPPRWPIRHARSARSRARRRTGWRGQALLARAGESCNNPRMVRGCATCVGNLPMDSRRRACRLYAASGWSASPSNKALFFAASGSRTASHVATVGERRISGRLLEYCGGSLTPPVLQRGHTVEVSRSGIFQRADRMQHILPACVSPDTPVISLATPRTSV